MGVYMCFGILGREDPYDPNSAPLIIWPAPLSPNPDTLPPQLAIHARPMRSISARHWSRWRQRRPVRALFAPYTIPVEIRTFSCIPIDDQFLRLLTQLHAHEQRWAWLPGRTYQVERAAWLLDWATRARATYGGQARLGFS